MNTQAAIEAATAVIQAMAVVRTDNNDRMQNVVPKTSGHVMQQSTFNWEAEDKYSKL